METDQAEQLDALLNQSTKVLEKNCDTEETDTSTSLKRENRSSTPFHNKDMQIEIVIVEKRDDTLITFGQQLEMTGTR